MFHLTGCIKVSTTTTLRNHSSAAPFPVCDRARKVDTGSASPAPSKPERIFKAMAWVVLLKCTPAKRLWLFFFPSAITRTPDIVPQNGSRTPWGAISYPVPYGLVPHGYNPDHSPPQPHHVRRTSHHVRRTDRPTSPQPDRQPHPPSLTAGRACTRRQQPRSWVLPQLRPTEGDQRFSRPLAPGATSALAPLVAFPLLFPLAWGAGRTVTFLGSYWSPAGPGRVRAHPRARPRAR